MSAIGLLGQTKITVDEKGELLIADAKGLDGQPVKWVETSPFVWQDTNGHDQLAAKVVDGHATRFSYGLAGPFEVFLRPGFARNGAWLTPSLYVSLAALLLTVVFWPITAIVRRRYGARLDLSLREMRAYRASKFGALLSLAAFSAWIGSLTAMFSNLKNTSAAFDPIIRIDQAFGLIGFVGGFLLILWNLKVVWTEPRRWPARLWSVVLVLAAAVMLWVAFAFHLIGWGVNY